MRTPSPPRRDGRAPSSSASKTTPSTLTTATSTNYDVTEEDFYTVMFGVSRALGVLPMSVWARALGTPPTSACPQTQHTRARACIHTSTCSAKPFAEQFTWCCYL